MSGSKIISKGSLSNEELSFCENLITKSGVNGSLIGAIKNAMGSLSPVILQGKNLKVIKVSSPIPSPEKILLQHLQERYQELASFYPDKIGKFGIIDQYFYYLRNFERTTLAEYLESKPIKVAEANYLVTKILNLILDLKRINFPHGHLSINNLIIDEKNLTLVDYGFGFCSSKNPKADLKDFVFLPPESPKSLTSDFSGDVYSLGKIIKYLYRGLQCPIPLDLPDQMCELEAKKRPSLIEVNNIITDTFTLKRNKTEHWGRAPMFSNESDPSKLYKGYLNPHILEQIREELARSLVGAASPEIPAPIISKPLNTKEVSPKSGDRSFYITILAVGALLVGIYFWNNTNIDDHENNSASQGSFITGPDSGILIPEAVKLTLQFLNENKITRAQDYTQILTDIYNANYQGEKLTALINPLENEEFQLIKIKGLVLLVANNPSLLDLIYQDLEKYKILPRYLNWFKTNSILDWSNITNPLKLMIISASIPEKLLPLEFYFDLTKHFDQSIVEATRPILNLAINEAEQKAFYRTLRNQLSLYDRDSLNFLNLALSKEKDLQLALISEWFQTTKPKNETVFQLVISRIKPGEGEDYFSFYAARYLREYLTSLNDTELEQLKNHHEKQLQVIYQIKKGGK